MPFTYRTTPLPPVWPGTPTARQRNSPFKANWGDTLDLLEREIKQVSGRDVALAIGVTDRDIRNDGGVRSDARIRNSSVILSFKKDADRLSFPCDKFNFWQDNVRAIVLALEALRKVDRYGVQSGKQYQGFKALPGAGGTTERMSVDAAAQIIRTHSDKATEDILAGPISAQTAVRIARSRTHPDRQPDRTMWDDVNQAAGVLSAHHGTTL